jgi:hypothetical protein
MVCSSLNIQYYYRTGIGSLPFLGEIGQSVLAVSAGCACKKNIIIILK